MELYHCLSARSFRPLWLIEELGLPCTLHVLSFPPRTQARAYLQLNPLGTVPLLIDGGTRMTESAAICQYLAARHSPGQLDVASDEAAYGSYLNWLHMSDTTLTFPQTLVLRYSHFEPPQRRQPQVVRDYARWFLGRLRAVEDALAERDFLCAGRFTAADIAVAYALQLAGHLHAELTAHQEGPLFGPRTTTYWERLQARAAYQRAQARQRQAAEAQGVSTVQAPDMRPFG